ncbi:MAG: ribonuclease PH [Christensenellales bacterium]|jgi:ribonuclease PH
MTGELRPISMITDFTDAAAGSVLISCGRTRVICTASVLEGVPPFRKGKGGWLTAEYAMLPGATPVRKARDGVKKDGRGVEIQRLIGRSLRAACDLSRLGERTVYIDCDVIQADGGTRTAAVTGAFVALCLAVDRLLRAGELVDSPIVRQIAAVSVGIVEDECVLDLDYRADSSAQVDMNIVMTREMNGETGFIEVQGTGEGRAYTRDELDRLVNLAQGGISQLMDAQITALGARAEVIGKKPRLVIASNNFGKLRELRALLQDRYDVYSMREMGVTDEIDEDGETFSDNARIKARHVMSRCGCAAIADDSGLAVEALGGRPGVRSARYAGVHGDDEANNERLLEELADVSEPRRAKYVCAIALCAPGKDDILAQGECDGEILRARRGTGGFGYDPLFLSSDLGLTFAEADDAAKNCVSHRARAIEALLKKL